MNCPLENTGQLIYNFFMETSADILSEPSLGKACKAAVEYGIDLNQLDASLALTPLERLMRNDQALELILAVIRAGIHYYGFNPRSGEVPGTA